MPHELAPGVATTRRYSEAEKERAVRAVLQLRKELGTDLGTIRRGDCQIRGVTDLTDRYPAGGGCSPSDRHQPDGERRSGELRSCCV